MRISVFGLGYVGSVTSACLARDGHDVMGVDVVPAKVQLVGEGKAPVIEPKLDQLVRDAVQSGRLRATLDTAEAIRESDLSLICVGTPSHPTGKINLQFVENVCRDIAAALVDQSAYHVVVVRSTVLPGTVQSRVIPLLEQCSGRRAGEDFGVCVNPEFLREGSAVRDYDEPSQIVIGQWTERCGDAVHQMYQGVNAPVVRTTLMTAEMIKYVNNALHAVKVVFANEIGNLCKAHGIDGQEVMQIVCQDRKLNLSSVYLRPGFAFGGSCLPKDLRALVQDAKEHALESPLLESVLDSNHQQIWRGIQLVEQTGARNVAVLGLSFKAGTDDVRESPVVPLVETLIGRGFQVRIYDEKVQPSQLVGANKLFLERALPHIASLMNPSLSEVVSQAEVVVIANAAPEFRQVRTMLREDQVLIDLVGICRTDDQGKGSYQGICW
jgi:GDP-mannose 6-dehydrogenase